MKALVIGGTGPTGPFIVQGLLDRGFEVTIYHRGFHEADDMPEVQHHLHGDPFELATLEKDFKGHTYDLVVGMYGRLRHVATAMAGKTAKLVGIGGAAALSAPAAYGRPSGGRRVYQRHSTSPPTMSAISIRLDSPSPRPSAALWRNTSGATFRP